MNKIATYLNQHLSGAVVADSTALRQVAIDGGLLARYPDMIVRAASTRDVRKVLRFATQLAHKGYILPVFARGYGTDGTSGASGTGVMIDMKTHLNRVIGIDPKQRLLHVQAGASLSTLNGLLSTHKGLGLPHVSYLDEDGTIGGAISTAAGGFMAGVHGTLFGAIDQMEIVLANGDVIQTKRLSRRELERKKNLDTSEGEIYRKLDELIINNEEVIKQIDTARPDTAGYRQLARVKTADGSFDLTPLFYGSQGSLGIISEVIVRAEFASSEFYAVMAEFSAIDNIAAAASEAANYGASAVEFFDSALMRQARVAGKKFAYATGAAAHGGVVLAVFDAFSERSRRKSAEKLEKSWRSLQPTEVLSEPIERPDITKIHTPLLLAQTSDTATTPKALSGMWLKSEKIISFLQDLKLIEASFGRSLPVFADYISGYVELLPSFELRNLSERQKLLQLLSEVSELVDRHDGSFSGFGGEGRLKANAARRVMSSAEQRLYEEIRKIFDPQNILAHGIKHEVPAKELAAELSAWHRLSR